MKMLPGDITKYPKFYQYVSTAIPTVRSMPFIINALKKFSGNASDKVIKDALSWNMIPENEIVPGLICAGSAASDCFRSGSNTLQIKEERVAEFEAGKGLKHTATGKLVYYVGVTLLHELCHWANDGTGKPDETHEKFEQALYGKIINASDK